MLLKIQLDCNNIIKQFGMFSFCIMSSFLHYSTEAENSQACIYFYKCHYVEIRSSLLIYLHNEACFLVITSFYVLFLRKQHQFFRDKWLI